MLCPAEMEAAPGTRIMHLQIINSDVVIAYSHFPRKAFLLHFTKVRGTPNDYARILEERASVNRAADLTMLQRTATPTRSYRNDALPAGAEVLTEANLEATNVEAYSDALRIVGQSRESITYEPIKWTPLSRPFFVRNKLMTGGVFLRFLCGAANEAAPPFRPWNRRSGRIPAEPYPPFQCLPV